MAVVPAAPTRWEPFTELADLRHRFERALEDMTVGPHRGWTPAIDVERREDALIVHADVPGFDPDEVRVEIQDDVLTIRGDHEETKEEREKDFVRRERRMASFARAMSLPSGVDAKDVKARTHDGVLEVTIPLPKRSDAETVTIKPTPA